MSSHPLDLDDLRSCVGRRSFSSQVIDAFPARALAAALDESPQAGHAALSMHDAWLTPTAHWLYFHDTPTRGSTGPDGHASRGNFLPSVMLPRRMWASGNVAISMPVRMGALASRTSTIVSVDQKVGRSGEIVIVELEHVIEQDGRVCLTERQNLVYVPLPLKGAARLPEEVVPPEAETLACLRPDPVLLFRYSALTYNGHRIHYDRDYAMRQESYPGLVVQGPLLATLLVEAARRKLPDASMSGFSFRAVRPTFDGDEIRIRCCEMSDGLALWTARPDGSIGMSARVTTMS